MTKEFIMRNVLLNSAISTSNVICQCFVYFIFTLFLTFIYCLNYPCFTQPNIVNICLSYIVDPHPFTQAYMFNTHRVDVRWDQGERTHSQKQASDTLTPLNRWKHTPYIFHWSAWDSCSCTVGKVWSVCIHESLKVTKILQTKQIHAWFGSRDLSMHRSF